MDVIALDQAGFEEAVAPLGTALTEHQIERLWKMVEVPILCFDGDSAGQKAAIRAAMRVLPLLRPGHSLCFATLPPGQDPDDLVRSNGPAAFESVLNASEALVDRLWSHECAVAPLDTPEQKAALKQRLSDITDAIAHGDVRAHYVHAFRERYDELFFSRPAFNNTPRHQQRGNAKGGGWQKDRRGGWKPPLPPVGGEARTIGTTGVEGMLLRAIIAGLLRHPDQIASHRDVLSSLRLADSPMAKLLAAMIAASFRKETVETQGLLTILGQGELYNMARGLLRADTLTFTPTRKEADADRARRDLDEAIRVMAAGPEIEAALSEATRRVMDETSEENLAAQQQALRIRTDHLRRLSELAQPEDID